MKIQFTTLLLIFGLSLRAQPDLSGAYGYSYAPLGNPPISEKTKGASGMLILLKMDGNKYRFWLDVSLGWPSYNRGETDGTVTFLNDTASFDNSYEEAASPCILKFQLQKTTIVLNSQSTSFNCGFGVSVNADGEYKRLTEQPRLDNDWLKKMYGQSPQATITANKAELYHDENGLRGKKQYFVKGDRLLSIAETEKTFYTEYIASNGKLVYGWIKKSMIQQ